LAVQARHFWKATTMDRVDLLDQALALLHREDARFCVIGGVAVNAYAEPVVTLDVGLVVAAFDRPVVERALARQFVVEHLRTASTSPRLEAICACKFRPIHGMCHPSIGRRHARCSACSCRWRRLRTYCRARCGRSRMRRGVRASGSRISRTSRD
jgi:hypothetical protein